MNNELSGVAESINGLEIVFNTKAGETGKLYGSITNQMIADAINQKVGLQIDRKQIEAQPIRNLGDYKVIVRLTVDLVPVVKVSVHREGETVAGKAQKPVSAKPATKEIVVETPEEVTPEVSE